MMQTYTQFFPGDTPKNIRKLHWVDIVHPEQVPAIAFARLLELLDDMEWKENWAEDEFKAQIAVPLGFSGKMVEMWFRRRELPTEHIFNVSAVLGVDAGWLAGQPFAEKKFRRGLYRREVERRRDHSDEARPKARREASE